MFKLKHVNILFNLTQSRTSHGLATSLYEIDATLKECNGGHTKNKNKLKSVSENILVSNL